MWTAFFYFTIFCHVPSYGSSITFMFPTGSSCYNSMFPNGNFMRAMLRSMIGDIRFEDIIDCQMVIMGPSSLNVMAIGSFGIIVVSGFQPIFKGPLLIPIVVTRFRRTRFRRFFLCCFNHCLWSSLISVRAKRTSPFIPFLRIQLTSDRLVSGRFYELFDVDSRHFLIQ